MNESAGFTKKALLFFMCIIESVGQEISMRICKIVNIFSPEHFKVKLSRVWDKGCKTDLFTIKNR